LFIFLLVWNSAILITTLSFILPAFKEQASARLSLE